MPRSKTGVKRVPLDVVALERAVSEVIKTGKTIYAAAKKYNIPKTTLTRHISAHKKSNNVHFIYENKCNNKKVFTAEEEDALKEYVLRAAKLNYGLSRKDLAKLAFQYANQNGKVMPSTWLENNQAGKEWLNNFLCRHKEIALRKPEATSLSRATSFNKVNVAAFFNNYKDCLARFNFTPDCIYNVDETGNSTVHVPPKVLAAKGQKQIGSVTSGERGINITMIAAVNAIGNHVPPMLIFPRVFFKDHMILGAPPGTIGAANPSGWSTEDLFLKYLKHFIAFVKPTNEKKILLIMDNHESHIALPIIQEAKENNVILLTLPPHTSHKLQPLDRTVFGPFKTFYNQAANEWMLNNPGKPMTIYDVSSIIGKAYPKAFSNGNIVKGFEVSGICPVNEQIFGEDEFLSSYVTDRTFAKESVENANAAIIATDIDDSLPKHNHLSEAGLSASTSNDAITEGPSQTFFSPEEIRPFPKAGPRKQSGRGRRKPGRTRILTDTPEKQEIETAALCKKLKLKAKTKKIKKKIQYDSATSSDDESLKQSEKNLPNRTAKKKTHNLYKELPDDIDGDFEADSNSSIENLFQLASQKIN